VTAYDIVQIPGWENLSLLDADAQDLMRRLDELAHGAVPDDVPRDTATPFRRELRRHLDRLVQGARAAGAGMLCLPTQRTGDTAIPASYTVSEWQDPQAGRAPVEDIIAALASESSAAVAIVDVDGQPALREEEVAAPDPDADELATRAGRRVTYTVAAPDVVGGWLVFSFVTIGDGDAEGPLADIIVELFDAQMSTLRWALNETREGDHA